MNTRHDIAARQGRPALALALLGLLACTGTTIPTVTAGPPSGVAVAVSPHATWLSTGGTQTFLATVTGAADTAVTWSIREGPAGGSVTPAGAYLAPSAAGTYHVVATSAADPSRSDEATVTVTAPSGAGSAAAFVGTNVNTVLDYIPERLFADAMKSSRPWSKLASGINAQDAAMDASGWPTEPAQCVVMADMSGIDGAYTLLYDGNGAVTVSGGTLANRVYDGARGRTTASVTITTSGSTSLYLAFPGAGGVRNVKLIRPGHAEGDLFNRDALARLAHFRTLRTLDYAQVNYTSESAWSERTLPSYSSQQWGGTAVPRAPLRAASWEHFIQLCNAVGANAWINIPDQASDDYVTKLAQLFRYGSAADGTPYTAPQASPAYPPLDPGLAVHLEWSNEVWNGAIGPQSGRNRDATTLEISQGDPHHYTYDGGADTYAPQMRRVAYQIKRISDLFRAVWGDADMMTRVRPVLAGQMGNDGTYSSGIRYLDHVFGPGNTFGNPPHPVSYFLFGLSGATYIDPIPDVRTQNATVPGILDALQSGLQTELQPAMRMLSTWAYPFGLRPLAYEGTHNLFAEGGGNAANLLAANSDAGMKDVIVNMYLDWFQAGGTLHEFSACIGPWNAGGMWALSPDPASEATSKWDAVKQVLASPLPQPTIGKAVPSTLIPADASLLGDGNTSGGNRTLQGADPDISYLVRAGGGAYQIATSLSASAGAAVRLEVDGAAVDTWVSGGSPAEPKSSSVTLPAGLHGVRLKLAAGASATVAPLVVTGG